MSLRERVHPILQRELEKTNAPPMLRLFLGQGLRSLSEESTRKLVSSFLDLAEELFQAIEEEDKTLEVRSPETRTDGPGNRRGDDGLRENDTRAISG